MQPCIFHGEVSRKKGKWRKSERRVSIPLHFDFRHVSNTWRIFEISQDSDRILAAFHRCCYYYHGTAGTSRSSDPIRRNKYFVKEVWQKVWYEGREVPRTLRHPAAILSKPLGKSRDTIILTNVNETRQGWNNTQPVQRGSIDPPLPSFFQNLARPTD